MKKEHEIKLKRVESVLKELVAESLATLSDPLLRGVTVVDVVCKRGKYDAIVYLDKSVYDKKELRYIIEHLKKAKGAIESYCLQSEGWFRCPSFRFEFDDGVEKINKMDELFAKIEKELSKDKNG